MRAPEDIGGLHERQREASHPGVLWVFQNCRMGLRCAFCCFGLDGIHPDEAGLGLEAGENPAEYNTRQGKKTCECEVPKTAQVFFFLMLLSLVVSGDSPSRFRRKACKYHAVSPCESALDEAEACQGSIYSFGFGSLGSLFKEHPTLVFCDIGEYPELAYLIIGQQVDGTYDGVVMNPLGNSLDVFLHVILYEGIVAGRAYQHASTEGIGAMEFTKTYRVYEIGMDGMELLAEADSYDGALNAMRNYYSLSYLGAHVILVSAETFISHDGITGEFAERPRACVASDDFVRGWLAGRASVGKLNAELEDIEAVNL